MDIVLSIFLVTMLVHDAALLKCFHCSKDKDSEQCERFNSSQTKSEQCQNAEAKCMVWRFYSEENNKTYIFERKCDSECIPGCTHLEDMENRFVSCTSCCNSSLCNTDNSAIQSAPPPIYPLVLSILGFQLIRIYQTWNYRVPQ